MPFPLAMPVRQGFTFSGALPAPALGEVGQAQRGGRSPHRCENIKLPDYDLNKIPNSHNVALTANINNGRSKRRPYEVECYTYQNFVGVWGEAPIGFPEGEKPMALGAEAASAIGWANNFVQPQKLHEKCTFFEKTIAIL